MKRSISQRVAAAMQQYDQQQKAAERRPVERRMRALERYDVDYEKGVEAYQRDGFLPKGATKAMREGFDAAMRAEFDIY